jgi:hypothetical protein
MKFSSLAERTPRVALLSLLSLGAYTGARACPCGCVRVPVDNLADRPAALAGAYTSDVRYDAISQDERDNGAHPHFTARHRNVTATVETSLLGVDWYLVVPRIDRTIATASASGNAVGLGDVAVGARVPVGVYRLIAGVKLPTGADDLTLVAPRRYLQPGSGSTDVLLGVRRDYAAPAGEPSFFWQLSAQAPVTYDENFRPGSSFTGMVGWKIPLSGPLALSIQGTAIRQFRDQNSMATVDASYGADNESAVFSSHLAAGLTCQVGETSRLYVYYSTVLNVVNKVRQSNGTVVNPVHAADVLSVGFNHRF